MDNENTLKLELEFFEKIRAKLLETNEGQFALIKGEEFIEAFTTEEQAYIAGVQKYGVDSFLIKKIRKEDMVHSIPALHAGLFNAHI